jgi:hypothetical protein
MIRIAILVLFLVAHATSEVLKSALSLTLPGSSPSLVTVLSDAIQSEGVACSDMALALPELISLSRKCKPHAPFEIKWHFT